MLSHALTLLCFNLILEGEVLKIISSVPVAKTALIVTVAGVLTVVPWIEAHETVLVKHYHEKPVAYAPTTEAVHYTVSGYDSQSYAGRYPNGLFATYT